VVLKLFNLVQPQIAIFGKKDYQQLRVIEALVRQLALPIQIIAAETGRDHDGLALSSRNGYLSPAERAEAPRLYQTLQAMQQRIRGGERNFLALENDAIELLRSHGWRPDYISLRHRQTLQPASADASEGVIVAAARLGTTRLIDNIEV
jgi:pantoate--beta-alanine ligase